MPEPFEIRAGYLPLLDSAVLIVAAECGFAANEGLSLKLSRETSWATIRDRIGVGHFDVAHMLAPMTIAASLNIGPLAVPMRAPFVLAIGGNAITVSSGLSTAMTSTGTAITSPASAGAALNDIVRARKEGGQPMLRFAVVHPHSSHNYDLRHWLAAAGIEPGADIDLTVVPPPLMPDALAQGQIDGFCVGEPWNTVAVRRGAGTIITAKAEISPRGPEKVLGATARFADNQPETLDKLIRALHAAAAWCQAPVNHQALAELLARPDHLNVTVDMLLPAIRGRMEIGDGSVRTIENFVVFHAGDAGRPRSGDARWLLSQMARWGDAEATPESVAIAEAVFSDAAYRRALASSA